MIEALPVSSPLGMELIDCVELPVLVVDRNLTLVSFNPAAAELLSLTPSDHGRQFDSIEMLAAARDIKELCQHVIASGISRRVEIRDGSGSWYSLSIGCHKTDQNIHGAVLTLTNVTAFRESLNRAVEEREYTKAVVNTIADALVIVDADLRVQAANQAFYLLFQTSPEKAHGVHLYQLESGHWGIPGLRTLVNGSLPPDYLGSLECEHEFLAIGRRTLLLNARRLIRRSHIGQMTLITIQDISERKRAMEALRESEQRFRALVQATSDVVYRMSADWTEMRQLGGPDFLADTAEPDRDWLHKYIPPEDQAVVWACIQNAICTQSIFQLEHRVLHADGSLGWTFSRAIPLKNEQGETTEWFGVANDVTGRKRAQEAIVRTEKLATLGRLAASIAHEINNPLEAIVNLLYLIQTSEGLPEDARQNAKAADAELKRIAHITRQSLGFYRETSGPVSTSVSELLDASLDLLQAKIKRKNATIRKEWTGDLLVHAVPGELRQIFSNLMANALDALELGGELRIRAKEYRSQTSATGGCIRVMFVDNGHGIRSELRSRIFDPFFSTKGNIGTGLGLWVTKQIVEKHGGSIRMRSRCHAERCGTAFSVTLPERSTTRAGNV
jgi:two-component system CheB/CheR fusion protein